MKKQMEFLRFFLRGLASLLDAGISLLQGLYSLRAQQTELWAVDLIERLIVRVSSGETFSRALKKEPKFFPSFVVSLAYLGEETASLSQNLLRSAEFIEQSLDFKTKVYSVLTYPAFLLGVMMFGIVVLLDFFLPTFFPVFEGADLALPLSTRIVLRTAGIFSSGWFWIGLIGLGGILCQFRDSIQRDHEKKHRFDSFLLALPGVGKVLKSGMFAQLTRTLAAAYSAGISLGRGLAILEETVENEVFRRFVQDSRLAIANGQELSEFFLSRKNFAPVLVGHLLAVGEKTGRIGALLPKCTRLLEEETEYFLRQFFTLLEPGILAVMGVMVTLVMLSVFSPLYGILGAFR